MSSFDIAMIAMTPIVILAGISAWFLVKRVESLRSNVKDEREAAISTPDARL
ncbi:hypothetical protein P7B02_11390 [Caulobacter segnis]|uniref:hypothetical protein n=1 Tax=Caulobacter segnis TaxID=88688 RepID=UPI0024104AE6|nr:hypothetical protein [Caulobacter segnis]MDG2522144.1 hypothetical protein [Caulobacter segnis]